MAVKLRLTRVGSKKNPIYRVVAADSRSPRDGKFIEILGRYNPQFEPSLIELDEEKVRGWLANGAQPTAPVAKLLKIKGIAVACPSCSPSSHGGSSTSRTPCASSRSKARTARSSSGCTSPRATSAR